MPAVWEDAAATFGFGFPDPGGPSESFLINAYLAAILRGFSVDRFIRDRDQPPAIDRRDVVFGPDGPIEQGSSDPLFDSNLGLPLGESGLPVDIRHVSSVSILSQMGSKTSASIVGDTGLQVVDAGAPEWGQAVHKQASVAVPPLSNTSIQGGDVIPEFGSPEWFQAEVDRRKALIVRPPVTRISTRVPRQGPVQIIEPTPPPPTPTPPPAGDSEMAIDWGESLGGIALDLLRDKVGLGAPQQFLPPAVIAAGGAATVAGLDALGIGIPGADIVSTGASTAGKLYNPRTGKWQRCRRRRRKLLTQSDFAALAQLKTIVGGGQALNYAVMKAVK